MFGFFRLALAIAVVVTHIGGVEIVAGIAVWGFFMLSGFLMTAVLNTKYSFDGNGLTSFALSRAIRLLPTYWLVLLMTIALIAAAGDTPSARLINPALGWPSNAWNLFANIAIVGQTAFGLGRIADSLSPSTWAVDVEVLMYACSCWFLANSERTAKATLKVLLLAFPLLWVAAKLAIRNGMPDVANELTYSFLPAALLPYACGTCLWFARKEMSDRWPSSRSMFPVALAGLGICAFGVSRVSVTGAYLLSLPCLAVLVLRLSGWRAGNRLRRVDEVCGRMSYPIYLGHWLCAYLVIVMSPGAASLHTTRGDQIVFTPLGFWVVLGTVLLFALVLAITVEGPIENMRHRIIMRNPRRRSVEAK